LVDKECAKAVHYGYQNTSPTLKHFTYYLREFAYGFMNDWDLFKILVGIGMMDVILVWGATLDGYESDDRHSGEMILSKLLLQIPRRFVKAVFKIICVRLKKIGWVEANIGYRTTIDCLLPTLFESMHAAVTFSDAKRLCDRIGLLVDFCT